MKIFEHFLRASKFDAIYIATIVALVYSAFTSTGKADDSAQTYGPCSPIFTRIEGAISLSIQCTNQVNPDIVYKFSESNVAFLSSYFDLDSVAVSNLLSRINKEHVPPYALSRRLTELVDEIKYLRSQVDSYRNVENAQHLVDNVRKSLDAMDLVSAQENFSKLIQEFEAVSAKQNSIENVENVTRSYQGLGKLLMSIHDYDEAYKNFAEALKWIPGRFDTQIMELRVDLAQCALLGSEYISNSKKLVDEALFAVRDVTIENSSLYLRALQLQIMENNDEGKYQESLDIFEKKLRPLVQGDFENRGIDLKDLVLCLSCTARAAIALEHYKEAVDITTIGINSYKNSSLHTAPELAPLLGNRSVALSSMGDKINAANDLTAAMDILRHNAPDGLDPSYPFLWLNMAIQATSPEEKKRLSKEAIISLAQNFPVTHENFQSLLSRVVGSNGGIMCFVTYPKAGKMGNVEFVSPPFYAFDPSKCLNYSFVDSPVQWARQDMDDLELRIRGAISRFIKNPERTLISVELVLCTEFIIAGWQDFGRSLCSERLPEAISQKYYSSETAEASFRMAQWSDKLGYDFHIDDDTMYSFAYQGFQIVYGIESPYAFDGLTEYASYLLYWGKREKAKTLIEQYLAQLTHHDKMEQERVTQLKTLLAAPPATPVPVKKRTLYAGPEN
jgi:tetratricopeptide (TPR) repeat protein